MLFPKKKQKNRKVLPIQDVEIGTWAEQNFMISIVKNMETGWDWIMNHCIQLRASHYVDYAWNANEINMTFYPYAMHNLQPGLLDLCPFIDKYMIPKSLVQTHYKRFSEFIECAIDGDFYLSTYLDQFFRDTMHGDYGFHHPNFVYGYDRKKSEIYLMDNFEKGKFSKKIVSCEQINRSFDLVSGDLWVVSVFLYKLHPNKYEFVPAYVKEQIIDYLEPERGVCYFNRTVCPKNIHNDNKYYNSVYFGINCYNLLQDYLEGIMEENHKFTDKDWRCFSMLCDHKHMMVQRYQYMLIHQYVCRDEELYKDIYDLEKKSIVMLNIFLKYILTNNKKNLEKMLILLLDIKKNDMSCMKRFADSIIF